MSLRPGTKYMGSVANDTGAELIEFIASTDDVALLELTHDTGTGEGRMRVWLGDDAHNLSLLKRPHVDTQVSLSDTGWESASVGGNIQPSLRSDLIPKMTGQTTAGVTITASSQCDDAQAWRAADDDIGTPWYDTGDLFSPLPSWLRVDFGSGNDKAVLSYSIQRDNGFDGPGNAPRAWEFQSSDNGTTWTTRDSRSNQTGWAVAERRVFSLPEADTGTVSAHRYWRFNFTQTNGGWLTVAEVE